MTKTDNFHVDPSLNFGMVDMVRQCVKNLLTCFDISSSHVKQCDLLNSAWIILAKNSKTNPWWSIDPWPSLHLVLGYNFSFQGLHGILLYFHCPKGISRRPAFWDGFCDRKSVRSNFWVGERTFGSVGAFFLGESQIERIWIASILYCSEVFHEKSECSRKVESRPCGFLFCLELESLSSEVLSPGRNGGLSDNFLPFFPWERIFRLQAFVFSGTK